jgi:hypothetical protein
MASAREVASDSALIDATLAALRDERRRAPADLLAILTVLLVLASGLMLAVVSPWAMAWDVTSSST